MSRWPALNALNAMMSERPYFAPSGGCITFISGLCRGAMCGSAANVSVQKEDMCSFQKVSHALCLVYPAYKQVFDDVAQLATEQYDQAQGAQMQQAPMQSGGVARLDGMVQGFAAFITAPLGQGSLPNLIGVLADEAALSCLLF
eukprot:81196-Amphidinium_carterae.1